MESQAALATAQHEVVNAKSTAEKLDAELARLNKERAAADTERQKTIELIAQNEAARPLVAEALRQITEAIAKVPDDAKLAEVQKQLTEQQKVMEGGSADLKAKVAHLVASIAEADKQLKVLAGQNEAAGKQSSTVAERVKSLQAERDERAKSLANAQTAAKPAEDALAGAQQAVARWQDEIAFRDQLASLQKELDVARQVAADRQATLDEANKKLAESQSTATAAKKQVDVAVAAAAAIAEKIQAARNKK
jgi:chromosome segregation ATPase